VIPVCLACDATPVSSTGLLSKPGQPGSIFAAIALPLNHWYRDLIARSIIHEHGHLDPEIMGNPNEIHECLASRGFACHFLATDGDSGMNPRHTEAFDLYQHCNGNLEDALHIVTNGGEQELDFWPISDLLHLMKNARSRIATGRLAFNGSSKHTISGQRLTDILKQKLPVGTQFCDHKPLDMLKDDLAIRTFPIRNMLSLWESGEVTGVYFMLPLVCLSLGVREARLSVPTRLALIHTAFSVFSTMAHEYPATGAGAGIDDRATGMATRTLWTKNMCIRGSNLCLGYSWAIRRFGECDDFWLALNRIGSHGCETHFGVSRGNLRGDTRAKQFQGAEVNAALIQDISHALGLPPFIRRFQETAG
jgi:hypothetical protein